MRENSRTSAQKFEVSLTARQACGVLLFALAVGGAAYYVGTAVGRRSAEGTPLAAPRDALARLDEPVPAREEAPPELKAQKALMDSRSIDQAMPVAPVKAPAAPAALDEKASDENLTPPPVVSAHTAPVVAAASPAPASPRAAAHPTSPPAPASGRYTIQVGSAPHRADAERLAKRLAARKARVVAADVPGKGRWYRVQVGSYATPEAARLQLTSLERSGVHGIVALAR